MNLWSISIAYRLGLGFHALNNEGADGSNLMQPRRIDVGNVTYDGISGEIIRRHILEHFVNICRDEKIPMLPLSEGLHPDRGPLGIRDAAKKINCAELMKENLFPSVRKAIEICPVLDVGGYLAAWKEQETQETYTAEKQYIENQCATYKDADSVKRESCFDVAWLISEKPQDSTITQHSAFRDSPNMNSRYAQTMRSNVYGGVIRADLHRIGTDDHWYLQEKDRLCITKEEQLKRQIALIKAIANFIASPTGARVAGWAPHVFLNEGTILLTSSRTAPFQSPIKVSLDDETAPIKPNSDYADSMKKLASEDTWVWTFDNIGGLLGATTEAIETIKRESSTE